MDSDKESFLRAIRQNPTDFALRKVYADFLQDRGDIEEADRQRQWEEIRGEAVNVINSCAAEAGFSYDELLAAAAYFVATQDYLCEGERWEGVWMDDDFWNAYEVVTDSKVSKGSRGGIFSCSC